MHPHMAPALWGPTFNVRVIEESAQDLIERTSEDGDEHKSG